MMASLLEAIGTRVGQEFKKQNGYIDNKADKQKEAENVIIARPDKIIAIGTEGGAVTGAVKIKIPLNTSLMGKMRIEFLCNNNAPGQMESMTVTVIGHYNYDSSMWTADKCSVQVADNKGDTLKVRYCTDSEGAYILIGEDTSSWYYARVCITEVITNNIPDSDFSNEANWDISVESTVVADDIEATVYGNIHKYRVFTDTASGNIYKEYYENGDKKIEEL
jgi:hypothetical protein